MGNKILEIKNLHVAYEEKEVLTGIDLDVIKGEVLCIVGESGSGKSTLIRTVIKDKAVKLIEGSILYFGQEISSFRERDYQKLLGTEIGFIQQNPWGAFNPIRTIEAQFKETARSHGISFDSEKLKDIMDTLGLKDTSKILKSCPYELSGGMSQRIAIAASFYLNPKLLFCDEITSALDVSTAISVCEELCRLKNNMMTTIVMVTHNLGMASNLADRIAIMYKGEIVEEGKTEEILRNPQHEYTRRLLRDVPGLKAV